MTVPSTTSAVSIPGTGSTSTFPYTWSTSAPTDLVLFTQVVATGAIIGLTLDADYTVSPAAGSAPTTGGTITLTAGNLPTGTTLFICSDPSEVQSLLLQQGATVSPTAYMGALDYLTRCLQATRRVANNSLQIPLVESLGGLNTTFPAAAQRAGQLVGFDALGNATLSGLTVLLQSSTSVATLSSLRTYASTPANGVIVATGGYAAQGDGGQGFYVWNGTDVRADNGGSVIKIASVTTGRWNLMANGTINAKQFGATGLGVANDDAAINAAIAWAATQVTTAGATAVVYLPAGIYMLANFIQIPSLVSLIGAGPFSTEIRWNSGSPPSGHGAVIDMSAGTDGSPTFVFGSRMVGVNVNGMGVAAQVVTVRGLQISSGIDNCYFQGPTAYGLKFLSFTSLNDMAKFTDITCAVGAGMTGILVDSCAECLFEDINVVTGSAAIMAVGINVQGNSFQNRFQNIQVESAVTAIWNQVVQNSYDTVLCTMPGGGTGTNAFLTSAGRYQLSNLRQDGNYTNAINDSANSLTSTTGDLGLASIGPVGVTLYFNPILITPVLNPSAAPSAQLGQMWMDSTRNGPWIYVGHTTANAVKMALSGLIFNMTANGGGFGIAAPTSLYGSGAGTNTIKANLASVAKRVRSQGKGTISRTSGTLTIAASLGGTVICTTGAVTPPGTPSSAYCEWDIEFTFRAIGASGSVEATGRITYDNGQAMQILAMAFAATTIDTTVDQAFDVTVTTSINNAGNGLGTVAGSTEVSF